MEFRLVRRTSNFDAAHSFYADVLEWPISKHWPAAGGNPRGVIFAVGSNGRLEFLDQVSPDVQGVSLAVQVDDLDGVIQRLRGAGHPVEGAVVQPWGHRNTSIVDPSGLLVTFFEEI